MKLSQDELEELLEDYKPKLDSGKANFICDCPECGQREFSVSLKENHLFGCYRLKKCGYRGNIFTLFKVTGKGKKYFQSLDKDINVVTSKINKKIITYNDTTLDLEVPNILPPMGWTRTHNDDYFNSRGFTQEQYDIFEVGRTTIDPKLKNSYVITLIRRNKELKGYIARHVWSKKQIDEYNKKYFDKFGIRNKIKRYLNSDTLFARLLFGIDEITENTHTVILTEGITDKFNIDRLMGLYGQEEVKCCSTFKCDISDEQIFLLQMLGVTDVILMYDPDVIPKIKKNAIDLEKSFKVLIGFYPSEKDAGDWNDYEMDYVLNNLTAPSVFNKTIMKMPTLKF